MISNAAFGVAKQLQERDSINCVVDVEFGRVARHGADVYAHGVVDVVDVDVVDALRSAWARPPVARFVSGVAVRGHANGKSDDANKEQACFWLQLRPHDRTFPGYQACVRKGASGCLCLVIYSRPHRSGAAPSSA